MRCVWLRRLSFVVLSTLIAPAVARAPLAIEDMLEDLARRAAKGD